MNVSMKKILTFITILMVSMCMGFAGYKITAKAGVTEYNLYVGGEEVTSANMSGDGWRFELAPEDDEDAYDKLYLNNATINSVDGKGISSYRSKLEIVLVGNNTIYAKQEDGYDVFGIYSLYDLAISGNGTLNIKCGDIDVTGNYGIDVAMIYCNSNFIVRDNVKINIEGGKVKGDTVNDRYYVFWGMFLYYGDTVIGKNSVIAIDGYEIVDGAKNTSATVTFIGIDSYGTMLMEENSEIRIKDKPMTNTTYAIGVGIDDLTMENNTKCYIDMQEVCDVSENVAFMVYGDLVVKDNVIIDACIKENSSGVDKSGKDYAIGAFAKTMTVGNNSVLSGKAYCDNANINAGVVVEEIVNVGNNSVIKGQGSMYAMVVEKYENIPTYLIGGSDEYATKNLSAVDEDIDFYSVNGGYAFTYDTDKLATYAQVGPKVTAKLDANGGAVSKSSVTKYNGEKLGTLPTPTRTGYTFTGWYTAKSGGTKVYSTTKLTKSMTLYAQWKKITYNITLNANGGSVGTTKLVVDYGNKLGTLPTPTRTGYTFTGWYTAATGGSKVYSTTKPTKSMTLYAQWKIKTYTINFDGNGGTVGVEKKWVDHGNAMEFMPTPKRDGYTFTGWYTAKTGGSKVYSTTKVTKNMTLYAQWKKNTCTITFNANGGKVSTTSKTVNGGTAIGTMPTPTRSGYTFTGWFTAKTGGSKVYSTTKATANMTLYAQWKK